VEVVVVLVFISICLVVIALLFFASRIRQGDFEHGDRLSLLPLESDEPTGPQSSDRKNETKPVTPPSNVAGREGEDPDDK